MDIRNSEYAKWLEDMLQAISTQKPDKMAFMMTCKDEGEDLIMGSYWNCDSSDKAILGHHMQIDGLMDAVMANASMILDEAERQREEQEDG